MFPKVSSCGRSDINNIRKEQTFGPPDKGHLQTRVHPLITIESRLVLYESACKHPHVMDGKGNGKFGSYEEHIRFNSAHNLGLTCKLLEVSFS